MEDMNEELKIAVREEFSRRRKSEKMEGIQYIGVGYPSYTSAEILAALDCLLDLKISQGAQTKNFEERYAEFVGVSFAVATNSGTSANLLALSTLVELDEVKPGSEVIVPAATFASVASPIYQLGLIPVYVDVSNRSWCIDPNQIEAGISNKTRVIMPVHNLGFPADMIAITEIAKTKELIVLEDCCEAHGATVRNRQVGSFGDLGTLSFFVAHNITTGEGGMVLTKYPEYDDVLRSLREFGRLRNPSSRYLSIAGLKDYDTRYIFSRLGFNVRMTDVAASIGKIQLSRLEELNQRRCEIAEIIHRYLERYDSYFYLARCTPEEVSTYYTFPIVVKSNAPFSRKQICEYLESRNIETRAMMGGCLPDQPGFINQSHRVVGPLEVSRKIRDFGFFCWLSS